MSSSKRSGLSCWMVVTRFRTSAASISGSTGWDALTGDRGWSTNFTVAGSTRKDGAGSVESQLAVAVDVDDLEDELRIVRNDLVADLRRRRWREEFARWLSGLGFWHREKLAEVRAASQGSMDFSSV
jgi:hypothetical protein